MGFRIYMYSSLVCWLVCVLVVAVWWDTRIDGARLHPLSNTCVRPPAFICEGGVDTMCACAIRGYLCAALSLCALRAGRSSRTLLSLLVLRCAACVHKTHVVTCAPFWYAHARTALGLAKLLFFFAIRSDDGPNKRFLCTMQ